MDTTRDVATLRSSGSTYADCGAFNRWGSDLLRSSVASESQILAADCVPRVTLSDWLTGGKVSTAMLHAVSLISLSNRPD